MGFNLWESASSWQPNVDNHMSLLKSTHWYVLETKAEEDFLNSGVSHWEVLWMKTQCYPAVVGWSNTISKCHFTVQSLLLHYLKAGCTCWIDIQTDTWPVFHPGDMLSCASSITIQPNENKLLLRSITENTDSNKMIFIGMHKFLLSGRDKWSDDCRLCFSVWLGNRG